MKPFVTYDRRERTYTFDCGDGAGFFIPEDDLSYALSFVKTLGWLADQDWFTITHLRQLIELSKEHAGWNVWRIAAE